jgi:hypothetical protein
MTWSETAPVMLNSPRGRLRGRSLLIMFVAGRPDPSTLTRVLWGESISGTAQLRPIERRTVTVDYHIERLDAAANDDPVLCWTFRGTDPMPHIVIWREGKRRCELWVFPAGNSVLRVYEQKRLNMEEPYQQGRGWQRALELRTASRN